MHESLYDRAVEMAKAKVEKIRVGSPLDMGSQMGPLNSAGHYQRVCGHVETARQEGAKLVTGGNRPAGTDFKKGYWLQPTIFADVTPNHRIGREEVFGPVMSFIKWKTDEEAIAIANDSRYALTASVFSRDITQAMTMARRIDAGVVCVNGAKMHFVGMPFGGVKDSGLGNEESLEELLSYTRTKAVHILMD